MSWVREKQQVHPAVSMTPSQLWRVMFMPASHMPTLASSIAVNVRLTDRCRDTSTCTWRWRLRLIQTRGRACLWLREGMASPVTL